MTVVKNTKMVIAATLEFRRAGTSHLSDDKLDQAVNSIPGVETLTRSYNGLSRVVSVPDNQIDALRNAVGSNYTVLPDHAIKNDI